MANNSLNTVSESISLDNLIKAEEAKKKANQNSSLSKNTNGAKTATLEQKKNQSNDDVLSSVQKQIQNVEREMYSNINTAMSVLNALPDFVDVGMDVLTSNSFTRNLSPLGLLIDLMKMVVTEEDIKKWLVEFLVEVLPTVEIGVKASLLANLKSIVSCSADPRIPKQLRKRTGEYYFDKLKCEIASYNGTPTVEKERGLLIDCDSIDPEGILAESPFTDKGKNNYFGVINDELKLYYKSLGISESSAYGTEENSNGDLVPVRKGNRSSMKTKWELCRAEDKNAFIWFVLHVAKFPSPTKATINGQNVEINGQNFFDEMAQEGGKTSLFSPLNLNLLDSTGNSTLTVGSTIVNEKKPNELSLCIGADFEEVDDLYTGETRIVRNSFVPVSSTWDSADWYVDRKNYYNYNLGFKENRGATIEDYARQKPICNLKFMKPTDYSTQYVGGSTQKMLFTILPKPYVYLPYIDTGEPLWRWKRILFDAYGNPDPNGNFSLPTEKMTSENLPYVHNDNISPLYKQAELDAVFNDSKFDDNLSKVLTSIILNKYEIEEGVYLNGVDGVKYGICKDFKTIELECFLMSLQQWQPEGTNDTDSDESKMKCISVLNECFQTKLAKEGSADTDSRYVVLTVGEKKDNCSLYISKETGEYFLADSDNVNNRSNDYTNHLVQCYNGLTVYEFNYDFVMGMRLFSPKVVCAKLLENATNSTADVNIGVTVDGNNYDYSGNKQSLIEIVREIIENESTELSDCFFSFNNDKINEMLRIAEEKRFNQQPYLNDKNETLSLDDIYDLLSQYPENGTKEEQKTVLNNAITAATAKLANNQNIYAKSDSGQIKIDFATNMLTHLAAVIIESLLSPKVLLLIAINKQIMGDGGETFNSKDLINGMKGIVISAIKEIGDLIMKKLLDYALDFIGPLAVKLGTRIAKEQMSVYQTILTQLLNLLRTGKTQVNNLNSVLSALLDKFGSDGGNRDYDLPSVLDNVDYADIIKINGDNTDSPVSNSNC